MKYRSNLLLSAALVLTAACNASSAKTETPPKTQSLPAIVPVEVAAHGYVPSTVKASAGKELTLEFKRTSTSPCGEEVVFPAHNIKKALPLNQKVTVKVTPSSDKDIAFTCGMGMMKGSIVAVQ